MDFENFDALSFTPEQRALDRFLKVFGVLLSATFLIPIGRAQGAPINVWDRFGVAGERELVQLLAPASVGLAFVCLAWIARFSYKQTAGITAGLLIGLVVVGVNPLEVLRVVAPPISGSKAAAYFEMTDGAFFPREDVLHLTLLASGLILLGTAGRYRDLLHSSRFSKYFLWASTALLLAYYLIPYNGHVPAARNIELYSDYYAFASEQVDVATSAQESLSELDDIDPTTKKLAKRKLKARKQLGMLRLTAVYYIVIYFVPLLLLLLTLPAWRQSQYKGHRVVFAQAAGWGASVYLLAFLFPLLLKNSLGNAGLGLGANLRSYILLAAVFLGLTVALSSYAKLVLEPNQDDEHLANDPLQWDDPTA